MWQPIETAPRNQTFLAVLSCAGEQTICTMRWPVAEAKNNRPEVWGRHVERVTHWMPLPDLPGAQPAPSVPSIEDELLRQSVLGLVTQYGDERAIEAYHGDLHCRKAPKDLFAEIERALETLSAPSVPADVITDYLVSISAHLAHQDDRKAQAELGELLKMLATTPKPEGE